ncbi:MAG TPA: hypothetical protein PKW55_03785 [Spirochaetota bacterium]|nr:hypothetical protein [Spirochaetota bacterium]HOM38044.1 hypothetical protein [Spirochaetota bacterium]HPQ48848.1 hypothetical protein [Spirochaetota bacterium]
MLENTYSQVNIFYLHSKPSSVDSSSTIMVGGKVSFGIWEYYEKNDAPAVVGDTYVEFGFGYILSSFYSPFLFYSPLSRTATSDALSSKNDRFYYELNIPFLNLSSYYKVFKDKKDIPGFGITYPGKKGVIDYLELMFEKYDKYYNVKLYTRGILGWFNIETEYFTRDKSFYYSTFGIEHLFLIRGDAKGETAYFSKKYAWGIGFYVFGGYYDATKDPSIEYNFTEKSDFPYTFGAGVTSQIPFMIFLDSSFLIGGGFLTLAAVFTDIPLYILGLFLGINWEFYFTRITVSMEGALIEDIGRVGKRCMERCCCMVSI